MRATLVNLKDTNSTMLVVDTSIKSVSHRQSLTREAGNYLLFVNSDRGETQIVYRCEEILKKDRSTIEQALISIYKEEK